jgi:hypothetical protein
VIKLRGRGYQLEIGDAISIREEVLEEESQEMFSKYCFWFRTLIKCIDISAERLALTLIDG